MKKIMMLFGYLAGVATAAKILKPKVENKEWESDSITREAVQNITEVHKWMFDQVKDVVWTEENQALLTEKRNEATEYVQKFKTEAFQMIEEMKEHWVDALEWGEDEVRALYEKRKDYISKAKEWGSEVLHEAWESLEKAYGEAKDKIAKK